MTLDAEYDGTLTSPPNTAGVKNTLVAKNITVGGHRTSVRLEPEMWVGIQDIARRQCQTLHQLCTDVAKHKHPATSLTAAIRVFIMAYFRAAATEDGHIKAGHGPEKSVDGPANANSPKAFAGETLKAAPSENNVMQPRFIPRNADRVWR